MFMDGKAQFGGEILFFPQVNHKFDTVLQDCCYNLARWYENASRTAHDQDSQDGTWLAASCGRSVRCLFSFIQECLHRGGFGTGRPLHGKEVLLSASRGTHL